MARRITMGTRRESESGLHCFIVGYAGEVGHALIRHIVELKAFSSVVLIGSQMFPLPIQHECLEQCVVDFDNLSMYSDVFRGLDTGFCCVSTTKLDPDQESIVHVEYDYVVRTAEMARAAGCKHFILVSAEGADKTSVFLEAKTKGQMEEAVRHMCFPRLSIFRPAFILTDHQKRNIRDRVLNVFLRPLAHMMPTTTTVPACDLALAMIRNALWDTDDHIKVFDNKAIHQLAKKPAQSKQEFHGVAELEDVVGLEDNGLASTE